MMPGFVARFLRAVGGVLVGFARSCCRVRVAGVQELPRTPRWERGGMRVPPGRSLPRWVGVTRNVFPRPREGEDCPVAGMPRAPCCRCTPGIESRDLAAGGTSVKSEIALQVWKSGKRLQNAPAAVEGCAAGRKGSTWVSSFPEGKSLVVAKRFLNPTRVTGAFIAHFI